MSISDKCMPIELYIELTNTYNRRLKELQELSRVETNDVEWKKGIEKRLETFRLWAQTMNTLEICQDD